MNEQLPGEATDYETQGDYEFRKLEHENAGLLAEVRALREALADLAYQASATGDRDPGLLEAIDEARALLASKTKGGGK